MSYFSSQTSFYKYIHPFRHSGVQRKCWPSFSLHLKDILTVRTQKVMNHFRCYFLPFFLCTPHRVAAVWGHHCCIFPFRFLYTLSFWGKVRTAAGALRSPYPLLHGSHYSAMFKLSCLNMLGYLQTYGFELEHLRCFLCSRSCCFFQKKKKKS